MLHEEPVLGAVLDHITMAPADAKHALEEGRVVQYGLTLGVDRLAASSTISPGRPRIARANGQQVPGRPFR